MNIHEKYDIQYVGLRHLLYVLYVRDNREYTWYSLRIQVYENW